MMAVDDWTIRRWWERAHPVARPAAPPAAERGNSRGATPMNLPPDSQWVRYSALCARLRPLPAAASASSSTAGHRGRRPAGALPGGPPLCPAARPGPPPHGGVRGPLHPEEPLGAGAWAWSTGRSNTWARPRDRWPSSSSIPLLLRTARAEALTRFRDEISTL